MAPAMRYLKLTIAYDGTGYAGWQVQPNGVTVQQRLEEAWQSVTAESNRIVASGRTDAGVHALAQVCSIATASELPTVRLVAALNAHLPPEIRVRRVAEAPVNFHAIRDAISTDTNPSPALDAPATPEAVLRAWEQWPE